MTTYDQLRLELSTGLDAGLADSPRAADWWAEQRSRGDRARPERILPGLPRRIGRGPLGLGRVTHADVDVDFGVWRLCDAAAAVVLANAPPETIDDLHAHGDLEERAMVMRSRTVVPVDDATIRLFGEAQRTNTQDHVDALVLDSNLAARAVDAGLPRADFNRLILKAAFVDMPLGRMFGAERHANEELSTMLQDFATEREAAGRRTWTDTLRLIGRAPVAGTVARMLGALEHGDDAMRVAAIDGLTACALRGAEHAERIHPFLLERRGREPYGPARTLLESSLETLGGRS